MSKNIYSFNKIKSLYSDYQDKISFDNYEIFVYDFGDGNLLPSHRHPNGNGIVSNSTNIDPSVYISDDSLVYGNVTIKGNVIIENYCDLCGDLYIEGIGDKGITLSDSVYLDGNVNIIGSFFIKNTSIFEKANLKNNGKKTVKHIDKVFI